MMSFLELFVGSQRAMISGSLFSTLALASASKQQLAAAVFSVKVVQYNCLIIRV